MPSESDICNLDLVWGIKAMSRLIDRTERQSFYLLEKGLIAGKRIGSRWVVSREVLIRFFGTIDRKNAT